MLDELSEVLDSAIYKEIASQAVYEAAQQKTDDPGAKELLKELASQETKHAEKLKVLKEKGLGKQQWSQEEMTDLKISNYLTGGETLEGAGLQDTLIFAMKREEESMDFYRRIAGMIREKEAKELCINLANEELGHKKRLETLYDQLFYEGE
ncbi:MAG: hypothetical protein AMJ70_07600 [Dehalococcoidia bacterium SG8_51_3]|nr:MAG: hypothetical protein AMJ70_07600 [Dehalococcoidia bacterium SG8_51_3]